MNCATCNEPLEPGVLFCANCGARVTPTPSAVGPTIVLPSTTADPAPQPYAPQPYTPQPYTEQYGSTTPQPYAPPQPMYAPIVTPTSTAATISLVFGILSWFGLILIGPIVAIIAGHMARNEIRASGGRIGGSGLATTGLVLGYIQIVLLLLACIGFIVLAMIGSAVR